MTTVDPAPPAVSAEKEPWLSNLSPAYRLILRWTFVVVTAAVGFHETLGSVWATIQRGGLNSFVVVVPAACLLAAIGVALRDRNELPIHDRETDVIVGIMGLVLSALIQSVLLDRYVPYFHLLRLDLVALWLFLVSASVVVFGLRPVYRFGSVWLVLLAVFPLPYDIAVIMLGGTHAAAGGAALIIAAVATGIAVGRNPRRGVLGSVAAWAVGLVVLAAMMMLAPTAPLIAYQTVPALVSIVLVAGGLYLHRRRGAGLWTLDRKMEPLAASQVWAGLPLVMIVAVALAFVRLPNHDLVPSAALGQIDFDTPLSAPAGWHVAQMEEFSWVAKMYGSGAKLTRQKFVADIGNPLWDKFARPRAIVVDTVTSDEPFAFQTFPAKVLYHVTTIRQSAGRQYELGEGVSAMMVNVVDDDFLITWNALDWTWGTTKRAQQITAFAVDDHEPEALFPEPTGALLPTLDTLFTVLLRGNAAVTDAAPEFKDADMLVEFSRGLVEAQMHRGGT